MQQDFQFYRYPFNPRKRGDKVRVCRAEQIYEGKVIELQMNLSHIVVGYIGPFGVSCIDKFLAYSHTALKKCPPSLQSAHDDCNVHLLE